MILATALGGKKPSKRVQGLQDTFCDVCLAKTNLNYIMRDPGILF